MVIEHKINEMNTTEPSGNTAGFASVEPYKNGKLHDTMPTNESLTEGVFTGGTMIGGGFDNTLSPASYNVQGPNPSYTYNILAFNDTLQQKPNHPDGEYYIHPGCTVRGVGCNNPDKHYTGVVKKIVKDYDGNIICLQILARKTSKIVSVRADDNLELLIPHESDQMSKFYMYPSDNLSIVQRNK